MCVGSLGANARHTAARHGACPEECLHRWRRAGRAYHLRPELQDTLDGEPVAALLALSRCLVRAARSRLDPAVDVADMVKSRWDGVVRAIAAGLGGAIAEGRPGGIKNAEQRVRCVRPPHPFITLPVPVRLLPLTDPSSHQPSNRGRRDDARKPCPACPALSSDRAVEAATEQRTSIGRSGWVWFVGMRVRAAGAHVPGRRDRARAGWARVDRASWQAAGTAEA